MPSAPKVYAAFTILPREWLAAVGSERHQSQGTLVIVANVKRDCDALLTDRGVRQYAANDMVRSMRVSRSTPVQQLIAAGAIDPTRSGVYVYYAAQKDQPVARINLDGTVEIVGHFRYEPGYGGIGLHAVPAVV